MLGGDLSNIGPQRWLVTLEVLTGDWILPKRSRFRSWEWYAKTIPMDPLVRGRLSQLVLTGVVLELVAFGFPEAFITALEHRLDKEAWPIAHVTPYVDERALASELAYRPEVTVVLDVARRALMWGSRGRDNLEMV